MTCALAALAPRSILDNEEARMNPDNHGGFEMGTWNFVKYLTYFEDVAGKAYAENEKTKELINSIDVYTPEATKKIIKTLKKTLTTMPKGELSNSLLSRKESRSLNAWCGIGRMPCYPKKNPLGLNHSKWYERLLKIFESGEAIVYYI